MQYIQTLGLNFHLFLQQGELMRPVLCKKGLNMTHILSKLNIRYVNTWL
jgi:hypothetical protein